MFGFLAIWMDVDECIAFIQNKRDLVALLKGHEKGHECPIMLRPE